MAAYADETYAQTFVDAYVLDTTAWDNASSGDRTKALNLATEIIDRLDFVGEKYDEDQENQFPRGSDTTVPEDIKKACVWAALAILEGVDLDLEFANLFVSRQQYADVRVNYEGGSRPEHVTAGVPSIVAWRLLFPYLRDPLRINIRRV